MPLFSTTTVTVRSISSVFPNYLKPVTFLDTIKIVSQLCLVSPTDRDISPILNFSPFLKPVNNFVSVVLIAQYPAPGSSMFHVSSAV